MNASRPVSRLVLAHRIALALAALLAAPAAFAVGGPEGATIAPDSKIALSDVRWMEKVALDDAAEVEAGKLAMSQARSDAVRDYGKTMVEQHSRAGQELETLAESKGVLLPVKPDDAHERLLRKLADIAPDKFDAEYMMRSGTDEHTDAAKLFEDGIASLKDADIRDYAARHLPAIKRRFELARDTREALARDTPEATSKP